MIEIACLAGFYLDSLGEESSPHSPRLSRGKAGQAEGRKINYSGGLRPPKRPAPKAFEGRVRFARGLLNAQ